MDAVEGVGLKHRRSHLGSFDQVVTDNGVSGVTRKLVDRTGGRRLFDLMRSGDILVERWVDRIGAQLSGLARQIPDFMRRGVFIKTIINGMLFEGATGEPMERAMRDALIGFMAALSQAQAEAAKEAQKAGIAHAKCRDEKVYLGRKPSYKVDQISQVVSLSGADEGVSTVAKRLGLSRAAVYRLQKALQPLSPVFSRGRELVPEVSGPWAGGQCPSPLLLNFAPSGVNL
jgi:DNA invertase Pin-like site-specific DNA recombinase